jgi:NAD(P)-dependent dehydrogenase (short-subunit alcohol dehydrogenase family)
VLDPRSEFTGTRRNHSIAALRAKPRRFAEGRARVLLADGFKEMAMAQGTQSGRVSVVTGGSGGMGIACARLLAKKGRVIIADVRERQLEAAAVDLRAAGGEVTAIVCDVTDAQAVAALAQKAAGAGQVGALVHTAGLSPTMADGRRIMNVNLIGSALIEQAFAPLMAPGGAAVMIASMAAHLAQAPIRSRLISGTSSKKSRDRSYRLPHMAFPSRA